VKLGFLSLATTAKPFPFEAFLASTALHASIGKAKDVTDKLLVNDENLFAGAKLYRVTAPYGHGLPGAAEDAHRRGHVSEGAAASREG